MKAFYTFIAWIMVVIGAHAQNLVLNPSLENYITCPGFGQFSSNYITDWDKPSYGSTDYYHSGCPGILPTQQVPRTGNAYAGIICYNYGTEYREYMMGTLASPLIPGATYYCEFHVSLNDGYIQAIKEIGAYLSSTPPGPYSNALHIPLAPQVMNTVTLLDDTAMWMRVSGYFLASGGEQYITIGNFFDDAHTTIVQVGNSGSYGSYYFVDDVWVSLSEGTGVDELENETVELYPNPVCNKLTLDNKQFSLQTIKVTNSLGATVFEEAFSQHIMKAEADLGFLAPGIYIAEICCGEKIYRKKLIKD